jgi:hypothetical protein
MDNGAASPHPHDVVAIAPAPYRRGDHKGRPYDVVAITPAP